MKQLLGIFILAVLSLFFAAPFSYAQSKAPAGSTESSSGQAVNLTAKAAVLIEGNSGEIILEKNKDTELVPASITKIMTLTLIMEALEEGKIQLTDSVSVSEYAASMGGSQVFLEPNETQTVDTMIKCISIASANDAAVAMAEKIAGAEPNFVKKMNEKAKELGCGALCFEGENDFYRKSGFRPDSEFGIRYHGLGEDEDASFFLCKELIPGYLSDVTGEYATPSRYFVDEEKAEEFDKTFPKKEKKKLPGQIF